VLSGVGIFVHLLDNCQMECLVKTCCLIRLTRLQSLLGDADIPYVVFDQHISALEGGIGAFPRRVMVAEGYLFSARALLDDDGQLYDD
jgi:hypothetical protein